MEKNLTTGNIWKTLLRFSLPFLLSCFLQTLYGLADLFIIGRFCGTESTTAVSVGSQIMHMLTVMIVGLAMGTTVLIGSAVGAEDRELKNTAIGNTVILFLAVSAVLTAVLLLAAPGIVSLMATPDEAVAGTKAYLRICFAGIPFIVAYNVLSSVFRGMGDSKSPMYFVAVACFFNIALDYLFIGYFGMGPAGAALGTTLSQTVSVLIALAAIRKKNMLQGLRREHFRPRRACIGRLLKVGIPIAAQDGFIQVSFILITIFANRRGLTDAAAVGVVEKIIGILFLVPSALLSSVSAMCAQNIGAGRQDRANRTLLAAAALAVGCGVFFAVLFQFIGKAVIGLFTSDSAVVLLGNTYLSSYVWDCVAAGIHFTCSGYFCACGRSGISFFHNLVSIILARIPIAYYASVHYPDTLFPMGWAAPIGSTVSVIICIIAFLLLNRKKSSSEVTDHG